MLVSIHPIVDQVAQWIDGKVCWKNKRFQKLPFDLRFYAVLRIAGNYFGAIKHFEPSTETEYWDPSEVAAASWESKKLGKERHRFAIDWDWNVSEELAEEYMGVLFRGLTIKFLKRCVREVEPIFVPIRQGDAEIVGWDESGRMELAISAQGSRRFKIKKDERFVSVIGLTETARDLG
jgi:hypothetical protein